MLSNTFEAKKCRQQMIFYLLFMFVHICAVKTKCTKSLCAVIIIVVFVSLLITVVRSVIDST